MNQNLLNFCFLIVFSQNIFFAQNHFEEHNFNKDTIKERFNKLNQKTMIELYYNEEVEKKIIQQLTYKLKFYNKNKRNLEFYLPLFHEQLSNEKLPVELKYLPVVESNLNPTATSKVGATGLWQLMFYTAIENGLVMNSYVDERMDPVKSTKAAVRYLKKLFDIHKDWDLAVASYNAGPRTISKAIQRSGGYQNYWNIRPFLPKETANYIPSFFATMYVLEYAKEHMIYIDNSSNYFFRTDSVLISQKVSMSQISKALNFPNQKLIDLNPSYVHKIVPATESQENYIYIPDSLVTEFLDSEKDIYELARKEFESREKPLPSFFSINSKLVYKIKYGDFLGKIAKSFGVTVSQIKKWNNLKTDQIKENQKIIIFPKKIPKN
ncbi:MAG: lytic transglycosylase [Bacteroidetes bacterium MED-G13]|nr:lytic transglycosylase [Flavobacteriaceae bacterium]PDH47077.1 MAG: lytic transglycosylase [Bacteroidetes bacterium MED-G13]|tara:strand:+ start:11089 stop:12228 length:1140 start_codon:yes stop_codon:yes gene_type:complete